MPTQITPGHNWSGAEVGKQEGRARKRLDPPDEEEVGKDWP